MEHAMVIVSPLRRSVFDSYHSIKWPRFSNPGSDKVIKDSRGDACE